MHKLIVLIFNNLWERNDVQLIVLIFNNLWERNGCTS